jgi:hypothetical protein
VIRNGSNGRSVTIFSFTAWRNSSSHADRQAQEFIDGVKQKLKLPVVSTDIMLKPDEKAVYSSSSVLYETRAVHSGVRVAKGVYIGGTSGRSLSTQQWAKLDTGCLTITNKRVVFVGTKEEKLSRLIK